MTDPITREERAALIERAQTFLDADEYNRLSHSNACEILRALVASEAEVERLREALRQIAEAHHMMIELDLKAIARAAITGEKP